MIRGFGRSLQHLSPFCGPKICIRKTLTIEFDMGLFFDCLLIELLQKNIEVLCEKKVDIKCIHYKYLGWGCLWKKMNLMINC